MTTCTPECPNASVLHCREHCPNCEAQRTANRAHVELFERYLAQRPQPSHTRTWGA